MTEGQYVTNDVVARLAVALLVGGGVASFAPTAFAVMAAGLWLLIISVAMARG